MTVQSPLILQAFITFRTAKRKFMYFQMVQQTVLKFVHFVTHSALEHTTLINQFNSSRY